MQRKTLLLSVALAALMSTSANAGDWNNGAGSLKDSGGMAGIPVPAPIPVAESFSWYVRADLGMAVASHGSATSHTSLGGHFTQGYDSSEGPFMGTLGFGRYMTSSLRWDVTATYRGDQRTRGGNDVYQHTTTTTGPLVFQNGNFVNSSQVNSFTVSRNEESRMANHTGLVNMYYDFNRGSAFTPYVGAGVGITLREGSLDYNEHGVCTSTTNSVTGATTACTEADINRDAKRKNMNVGLAAAAMVGFSYEVSPGVLIDTGYRLMWQGGQTSVRDAVNHDILNGDSRIDHEIRAGLRWNVW
ncbi:MAG: opacity family porin [Hyphomicrobiaceae bacterium]